jgi:CRP-like cAMP-binding protein
LYCLIDGRVKIVSATAEGSPTIIRIVGPYGLFGEASLVGAPLSSESAIAIDDVSYLSWTRTEVEAQIEREPRLGIAMSRYAVQLGIEQRDRIEGMAAYKTPERVMLALAHLGVSLGQVEPDGLVRMAALTHHTLAEYVGTSREIVTYQLNALRRKGLLRYSRKHVDVDIEGIRKALAQQGIRLPQPDGETLV